MNLPVLTPANWKAWLCGWLRNQPEVNALVNTRVYSRLPAAKVWPAVRVTRIAGGPTRGTGGHLHDPLFQIDVFADDEATAETVMSAVAAVLVARGQGHHAVGSFNVTVSDVQVGPIHEGWDADDPTIACHRSTVRLFAHV